MTLPRTVAAETLDSLAETDPAAMRSRRDLQRIHRVMGTRAIVVKALRRMGLRAGDRPLRVLELGAGDGSLMLGIAQALAPAWSSVELTLLDRQALVAPLTIEAYAALGWQARSAVVDVLDWAAAPLDPLLRDSAWQRWDVIVANLFLHHFEGPQLHALIGAAAARSARFFACEPRRARLALAASHLVGALGANAVTRADAVLSVHAGFSGRELTSQWGAAASGWTLEEYSAGLFSHCVHAERIQKEPAVDEPAPPMVDSGSHSGAANEIRCAPTSTR